MIGDTGSAFSDFLLIQEKGVAYEKRADAPGFFSYPIFQTAKSPLPTTGGHDPKWGGINPGIAKTAVVFDGGAGQAILH